MNNEAALGGPANGSSSHDRRPRRSSRRRRSRPPPRPSRHASPSGASRHASPSQPPPQDNNIPEGRSAIVMRKVRAGLSKRLSFFTELMTHLDMIVYAELCTLYYMDCSFFRLFMRAVAQSLFLSPKSDDFLLITPAHKPHVFAVFVPNGLCLLLHLLAAPAQASEANRGYLHGGILIDFIGQRAPSSRLVLVLLDFVVLALQCLMLAVHTEREKLRKLVVPLKGNAIVSSLQAAHRDAAAAAASVDASTNNTNNTTNANTNFTTRLGTTSPSPSVLAAEMVRELGAAERGEARRVPPPPPAPALAGEGAEGIELRMLSGLAAQQRAAAAAMAAAGSAAADAADDHNGSEDEAGSSSGHFGSGLDDDDGPRSLPPEQAADLVLNMLASGANLCDFYVVNAIKEASRNYQGVAAQSMQTIGFATTLARLAAQRGVRPPTQNAP